MSIYSYYLRVWNGEAAHNKLDHFLLNSEPAPVPHIQACPMPTCLSQPQHQHSHHHPLLKQGSRPGFRLPPTAPTYGSRRLQVVSALANHPSFLLPFPALFLFLSYCCHGIKAKLETPGIAEHQGSSRKHLLLPAQNGLPGSRVQRPSDGWGREEQQKLPGTWPRFNEQQRAYYTRSTLRTIATA